jgi:hypothetical protein
MLQVVAHMFIALTSSQRSEAEVVGRAELNQNSPMVSLGAQSLNQIVGATDNGPRTGW